MINRRTTLLAMIGASVSCVAVGRSPDTEQTAPGAAAGPVGAAPAGAAPDRTMQDDLAKMGSHEYSDEGIPVFLACVNVVAEQAGMPVAPPTELSRHVAADLRRYGDAWHHMHPDAPDTDVSKVIEVLAGRDFAHDGKGGAA